MRLGRQALPAQLDLQALQALRDRLALLLLLPGQLVLPAQQVQLLQLLARQAQLEALVLPGLRALQA